MTGGWNIFTTANQGQKNAFPAIVRESGRVIMEVPKRQEGFP